MTQSNLNAAIDELRTMASDTAKLHGVSLPEILVYATAYELIKQVSPKNAIGIFAEALVVLKKAGA